MGARRWRRGRRWCSQPRRAHARVEGSRMCDMRWELRVHGCASCQGSRVEGSWIRDRGRVVAGVCYRAESRAHGCVLCRGLRVEGSWLCGGSAAAQVRAQGSRIRRELKVESSWTRDSSSRTLTSR
eukprot:815737-Rhodomonas_salina.1